ncbi:MAG: UDP-3-O-(3-hydroxymyristoyl)glucosamine N-acyltransferase [Parachlamydiales bacterium]
MPLTCQELAALTGATLIGDPNQIVEGVADIASATQSQVSFLMRSPFGGTVRQYLNQIKKSQAGALFIDPEMERPDSRTYLIAQDPSQAFQKVVEHFSPPIPSGFEGIHPTAVIHPTAKLGAGVTVGPNAVIDQGVTVGDNTQIGAGVSIGAECQIGTECLLYPNATLREGCTLGNRVVLQPGCVIGSCGFGFTTDLYGKHHKIKQLGRVHIEDDVEIGANTTIDRARFGITTVKAGTKIDNLVQIAHGVQVGKDNLIAGQTGIAGSTTTGNNVVLAGQVAVAGHLHIGERSIVAARSGVIKDLPAGGKYVGAPAEPFADHRRFHMNLMRLNRLFERVKALEER